MKLSEKLQNYRADRPDEWTMDAFIRDAKKLEDALDYMTEQRNQELARSAWNGDSGLLTENDY